MNKYLYPIKNLKTKSYIKWWLYRYLGSKTAKYILSEILEGTSFTLDDSVDKEFNIFEITGNTTQESTTGKNLFSGDYSQFDSIGGEGNLYAYFKLPNDGETYTLTAIAKNSFSGTSSTFLGFTSKGGETGAGNFHWIILNNTNVNKGDILTFSTNELRFISLYSKSQKTLKTLTDNFDIQLEKSSTRTAYEPYTGGIPAPNPNYPQEIKNTGDEGYVNEKVQNKNLTVDVFEDKLKITASGSNRILEVANYKTSQIVKVKPSTTYVIDGDFTVFNDGVCRARAFNDYPELGIVDLTTPFAYDNERFTITTDANTNYLLIYNSQDTKNIVIPNMFVCEEQYADTYVAHEEQVINFPLAQGQKFMQGDYLADDGVHHVMKKWIIDENNKNLITSVDSAYGTYRAIIMKSSLGWISSFLTGICLMNRYKEVTSSANVVSGTFSLNFWNQGIEIYDDRFTDLATARNLMVGTVIQIKQAQETIDPYTEEQQQAWNEIKKLKTYKPVTHISSEDETPANLKIQYWKEG